MADTDEYEELLETHRKEKRDLHAKTQKLKHSIPKGDKKKKKEITAEITQMISDLDLKHQEEIKNYELTNPVAEKSDVINESSLKDHPSECVEISLEDNDTPTSSSSQRLSKAQKRRNKKVQQQKEREKAIAEQEIDNLTGLRHIEFTKIKQILSERGFSIYEIPSDGNCLYKAIEHQLSILNLEPITAMELREKTSNYLLQHKEEYLPFLANMDSDEILSDDQFEKYCSDIVNTPAWGGHVEIKVLSSITKKPIEVIQADGPSLIMGEDYLDPKIIISYHRYAFGLGEHYNSVIPAIQVVDGGEN